MNRRISLLVSLSALLPLCVLLLTFADPARAVSTITVTTTQDVLSGNDGLCSLREAVIAANTDTASGPATGECAAGSGPDIVIVPSGIYTLSTAGGNEDASATGDLDILFSLTLVGSGATQTIVDANDIDRAFDIRGTNSPVVTITGLAIRNGTAAPINTVVGPLGYGSGIQSASHLTLNHVHLLAHTASGPGGAIYAHTRPVTITNSLLANNYGGYGGGGIYSSGGLYVANSLFQSNSIGSSGGTWGGGVWAYNQAVIVNSTFSGNTGSGSAIRSSGTVYLLSSTLATDQVVVAPPSDKAYLRNSIVAGGCSGTSTSLISQGYNWLNNCFVSGDLTGNVTSTVQLDPLQDNGGPTLTHALLPGSPAIDAGNPAGCTDVSGNLLATDQRGFIRPAGGRCDIGAFEYGATAFLKVFLPLLSR